MRAINQNKRAQPFLAEARLPHGRPHRLYCITAHGGLLHTAGAENLENAGLSGDFPSHVPAARERNGAVGVVWLFDSLNSCYFNE